MDSKRFIKILNFITNNKRLFLDKSLDGGGFHKVLNKGYLNVHVDFSSHYKNHNWKRVLNLLIYFNKNWKKKYNGIFNFMIQREKKKKCQLCRNIIGV